MLQIQVYWAKYKPYVEHKHDNQMFAFLFGSRADGMAEFHISLLVLLFLFFLVFLCPVLAANALQACSVLKLCPKDGCSLSPLASPLLPQELQVTNLPGPRQPQCLCVIIARGANWRHFIFLVQPRSIVRCMSCVWGHPNSSREFFSLLLDFTWDLFGFSKFAFHP